MKKATKPKTPAERFYEWMLKCKNVHTSNQMAMDRAFTIVSEEWAK